MYAYTFHLTMHVLTFPDHLTFNIVIFLCIAGKFYDSHVICFVLINVVSPEIQVDRS